MNLILVVMSVLIVFVVGLLFWMGSRLRGTIEALQTQQQNNPALQLLQNQVNNLGNELSKSLKESAQIIAKSQETLAESQKTVGERLDKAAQVVGQVQKSLGTLDQRAEQIFAVGKDIASLQEILRAPKLRGVLGELSLGDLLAQILPPKHYSLQYTFKTGETVDAVVKLGERGQKLVSVDSKFPLENFRRMIQVPTPEEKMVWRKKFIADVKKHVDAIQSKYILPDEGTFDFALMFIMAENVYYETIIKDENMGEEKSLVSYAFERHVIPVSPNSFYAYLHTIILGLRGLQVEENAKAILEHISRLKGDFLKFQQDFDVLGKHLGHARGAYEEAGKRLDRFGDKLEGALEATPEPDNGLLTKSPLPAAELPGLLKKP